MGFNHPREDNVRSRSSSSSSSRQQRTIQETESLSLHENESSTASTPDNGKHEAMHNNTTTPRDDDDAAFSSTLILPLTDPPATESDHDHDLDSPSSEDMATIGVSNVSSKIVNHGSNSSASTSLLLSDLFSDPSAAQQQQQSPPLLPQQQPVVVSSQRIDNGGVVVVVTTPPASPGNPKRTVTIQLEPSATTTNATTTTLNAISNTTAEEQQILRSLSAMDMEEVSCLLREQDADLLERQQIKLANDATPLLHPRKQATAVSLLPDLPSLPPPAAAAPTGHTETMSVNTMSEWETAAAPPAPPASQQQDPRTTNEPVALLMTPETPNKKKTIRRKSSRLRRENSHLDSATSSTDGSTHPLTTKGASQQQSDFSATPRLTGASSHEEQQHHHHHHLIHDEPLSGQVYQQQDTATTVALISEEAHGGVTTASSSHATTTTTNEPLTAESSSLPQRGDMDGGTTSHNHHHHHDISRKLSAIHRTDSMDRRLCEAAQFAEAVGDATVADELQILDEEDQSDDDDDDDDDDETQTIVVENLPAMLIHAAAEGSSSVAAVAQGDESIKQPLQHNAAEAANLNFSFEVLDDASVATTKSSKNNNNSDSIMEPITTTVSEPCPPFPSAASTLFRGRARFNNKIRLTTKRGFLDQLPTGQSSGQSDYVYKGLGANPPEIVKRGIQRGNYAQLHRKAWLEVSDKYHRYGKNLRFYYRHWEKILGCPFNMFFDWLDSKGEAAGQPLPEIEECPRAVLDSDTVLYITDPEVTEQYALAFVPDENGRGRVVDPIDGSPISTGPDGWIFVLRDNHFYGAQKVTSVSAGHRSKQRFHHSSFFGGKAVAAAGIFITDENGFLTRLYPHSGHYRPREAHMQRVLFFLHHVGVDLRSFDMDMQQILHVSREEVSTNNNNKSAKAPPPATEEKKAAEVDEKNCGQDENQPNTENNNNNINNSNNGDKQDDGAVAVQPPPPEKKPEKKKKVESLCLMPAVLAACFLAHKARFIGGEIFEQIHKIRRANARTVSEALDYIDETD